MFVAILLLLVGFAILIFGADFLVNGASSVAKKNGISNLAIGLTVVAFGTSMPELVVSYDDVAGVLLDHLAPGGRFSRARVGVALPPGQRGEKVYQQGGKTVKVG